MFSILKLTVYGNIGPLIDVPMERVQQTFDANTFGALRTARTVIPHMAARKKGMIVNVGSIVGEVYVFVGHT